MFEEFHDEALPVSVGNYKSDSKEFFYFLLNTLKAELIEVTNINNGK
jgi:hypothetical protein